MERHIYTGYTSAPPSFYCQFYTNFHAKKSIRTIFFYKNVHKKDF